MKDNIKETIFYILVLVLGMLIVCVILNFLIEVPRQLYETNKLLKEVLKNV